MKTTRSIFDAVLRLLGFGIATALLLGGTYSFTKDKISTQQELAAQRLYSQLIDTNSYTNNLNETAIDTPAFLATVTHSDAPVLLATNHDELAAVLIPTDALDGYSGRIKLLIAIDKDGNLLAVRVLAHRETPGLGDAIEVNKSDWILGFNNLRYSLEDRASWDVAKYGGDFDQFTGATVTPRAVVRQVERTLNAIAEESTWLKKLQSHE